MIFCYSSPSREIKDIEDLDGGSMTLMMSVIMGMITYDIIKSVMEEEEL